MIQVKASIISKSAMTPDMHRFAVAFAPGVDIEPGMFAHIAVPSGDLILRRPISVMGYDASTGVMTLGIRASGEGTQRICALEVNDHMDIIAPLGNGFNPGKARSIMLIGGGVGVAPLIFAAERYNCRTQIEAFLGFRSSAFAYGASKLRDAGVRVAITTDDGSLGKKGLVTRLAADRIENEKPSLIMTCGPLPMLKEVQRMAAEYNVPCQISLEERMGCGVGACLVCACAVTSNGGDTFKRVCADGPVFNAMEVALN